MTGLVFLSFQHLIPLSFPGLTGESFMAIDCRVKPDNDSGASPTITWEGALRGCDPRTVGSAQRSGRVGRLSALLKKNKKTIQTKRNAMSEQLYLPGLCLPESLCLPCLHPEKSSEH